MLCQLRDQMLLVWGCFLTIGVLCVPVSHTASEGIVQRVKGEGVGEGQEKAVGGMTAYG